MSTLIVVVVIGLVIALFTVLVTGALREDKGRRVVGGGRHPKRWLRGRLASIGASMASLDARFWRAMEAMLPPAPYVPAREVAESAGGLGSPEKTLAAGAAPAISEAGAVPADHGYPHFYTDQIGCEDCKREYGGELGAPDDDAQYRARPPMSTDPAPVLGVGWQVPDGWQPGRPVNGRYLGTQPRRTLPTRPARSGHPPWDTAAQPVLPPEPAPGPARPWDQGDGIEPLQPVRPYLDQRPLGLADLGPADPRPFSQRVTTNG